MLLEEEPSLYLYRLRMGRHEQTGVAGCFSVDEYENGSIKKHEKTRKDKEDDRTRHMLDLRAQTGVVFLTYRASAAVARDRETKVTPRRPLYDVTAPDAVRHQVWRVPASETCGAGRGLCRAAGPLHRGRPSSGGERGARARRASRDRAREPTTPIDSSRSRFPTRKCRSWPTTAPSRIWRARRRSP